MTQLLDSPCLLPGNHFLPTYTNGTWPLLVSYCPFSPWCPVYVTIWCKLFLFQSTWSSNSGFAYEVLAQYISLHSFLYLVCLPKSHLPSEQNLKPPLFHTFKKKFLLDHIKLLCQLWWLSLLSPAFPPFSAYLLQSIFLVSHPRDWYGFPKVNFVLL